MIQKELLEKLNKKARNVAEPLIERWEVFSRKVKGRNAEVIEEAMEGIDDIIAMNPTDYGPISAAFSAVKGRYHGLSNKVDKAVEKLEQEWDDQIDDLDLKEKEYERLGTLWSQLVNESRALQAKLERDGLFIEVKKGADWARTLKALSEQESSTPVSCPQCGGPLNTQLRWRNINEKCPHCEAVNELIPLPATSAFFVSGLHNLAMEAAWEEWVALEKAEARYHDLRHPSLADKEAYVSAAERYWTAYYTYYNKHHPQPPRTVAQSTADKVIHYKSNVWDEHGIEERELGRISRLMELVGQGKKSEALTFFKEHPGLDVDEAILAINERGDHEGVKFLLAVQYELERDDIILSVTPSGVSLTTNPSFERFKKERLHELAVERQRG